MAVTQRKRGRRVVWLVQLRDPKGQPYPSKTFESKKDAVSYEAELVTLKTNNVKSKSREMRQMSMAQYWIRWAAECRTEVSDGWKGSQDQMWRDHLEPFIGLIKLIELDRSDVALLLSKMKTKGLGAQMRVHLYNLLHKMFDDAVETYEVRDTSPVVKKFKPEIPTVSRQYLKPVIAEAFLKDVASHRLGAAFWLMIHCGFRAGEIQMMKRGNLDFDEASITIDTQWVRKSRRPGPLKNGLPLTVPMPVELIRYLRTKLDPKMRDDAFIVTNQNGKMLSHSVLYKELKALCLKHKLPSLSPHELRHTCSVMWADKGATKEDIKQLFNHASSASTETYMHDVGDRLRRLSKKKPEHSKGLLRRVK